MNKLYQTIGSGDLKTNVNNAFKLAEQGPVVVLSRTQPKAVMVSPHEWNRIAERLELLEQLQEARRIIARNDANNSWVSSEEARARMAKHGISVED